MRWRCAHDTKELDLVVEALLHQLLEASSAKGSPVFVHLHGEGRVAALYHDVELHQELIRRDVCRSQQRAEQDECRVHHLGRQTA